MPENLDDYKSYTLHEIVQPLLDLETPQEIFERTGNLLVEYLGMDLAAIGEPHQDGEVAMLAYAFSDAAINQVISSLFPEGDQKPALLSSDETTIKLAISQSLETGLPTTQHVSVPHPLSLACLLINHRDSVNLVLIVGLRNQQHFPKQLLQLCLVIAGLVRSNLIRLSYEQDLQTIQGRLQLAQEIAAIGDWSWDIASGRVDWSPQVYRIFAAPAEQATIELYRSFIHPDDLQKWQTTLQQVVEKKEAFSLDHRAIRTDGVTIWVHLETRALFNKSGIFTGYIGTVQDITQSKNAEVSLSNKVENPRAILNSIGDAVISTDLDGNIVHINPIAATLTGCDITESIGQPLTHIFNILNPITRKKATNPIHQVLQNQQVVNPANSTLLIAKDGKEYQIAYSAAPISDRNGNISGAVLVFRDGSEEYRIKQKISTSEEMFGLLAENSVDCIWKLDKKLRFTYLSPSLENIAGFKPEEWIGTSLHTHFISDLLDFTRLHASQRSQMQVSDLLTVFFNAYSLPENIQLIQDIPADLPALHVDPHHMQQVLENLVTNAVQAMPQGGELKINCRCCSDLQLTDPTQHSFPNNFVLISISDTGPGIPPQNIDKIFEPLFTTKPKGIGLGLPICKKLVEANYGKISVQNNPKKGATFSIMMPVHEENA